MKMVWAALALVGVAALGAGKKDVAVGADAVWRTDIPCGDAQCLAEKMASAAPPAAVAFSKSIGNQGWLRDFRKVGRVDIAYLQYVSRGNGWLLVNGSPSPVDVDNLQKMPKSELADSLAWSKLIAQNPHAALFPGDRTGATNPIAILNPDGSQEFVVGYKVLDGCPTCAQLGAAYLGFEFNAKGRFTGSEFIDVIPSEGVEPIHIRAGQKFTLALPGDTKQQWTLAQEPARWILRSVNQTTDQQTSTVFWTFAAISNGTTQMTLTRSPGDTLTLRVVAAPGLGH